MNQTRAKAGNNKYDGMSGIDNSFNQQGGGFKVVGPILGNPKILGSLGTAVGVDLGSLVAVFNNSAAVAWAAIGPNNAVAAPAGGANGIALPPYAYTTIAMFDSNYIICSAATCFGYLIKDDLMCTPSAGGTVP
jgi:hypothetical protein